MVQVHPEPERLAAFRLGKLSDEELSDVERHVADCDSCCRSLKSLPDDSFVLLVRDTTGLASAMTAAATWDQADTALGLEPVVPADLRDHPRYEILEKLGEGGMGVVYKARHRHMNRIVALKVLAPKLLERPASVERFKREWESAARLVHPNIVTAYDADQAGQTHFLVMEYVAGTSLARLVEESGPLPLRTACVYIRQAALGLQHAHEQGMVHRDIKPQNLMVSMGPVETVKILDFGLARAAVAEEVGQVSNLPPSVRQVGNLPHALTQASTIMGTPEYIAPEQAQAASRADIRADIYSLGCTLYHLVAGQAPFPRGSALQKVRAHLEETPRPLRELRPEVCADLAHVLDKMLAKDPAQRYQTPAEVADALTPFTTDPSPKAPPGLEAFCSMAAMLPANGGGKAPDGEAPPAETAQPSGGLRPPLTGTKPRRRLRFALAASLAVPVVALACLVIPPLRELAQTVIRIASNRGELVIEADDEDIEIVITQAGKAPRVEVIHKQTRRSFVLTAVDGEILALEKETGLRVKTTLFELSRGGRQTFSAQILLAARPEPGFQPLFNGKDLDGFDGDLGAWRWDQDTLRAVVPKKNLPARLWTQQSFTDFELEFDVRVPDAGDLGILVRGKKEAFGNKTDMVGYHVRLDGKQPQLWGQVDQLERGGWRRMLVARAEDASKTVKPGDMNRVLIRCVGQRLTVQVNGVTTLDDTADKLPKQGVIGFRCQKGSEFAFRNLRVRDLAKAAAAPDAFKPLFGTKDFAGWSGETAYWRWQDDALHGKTAWDADERPFPRAVWSKRLYKNFELRLEAKTVGKDSMGTIRLRNTLERDRAGATPYPHGLAVELGAGGWGQVRFDGDPPTDARLVSEPPIFGRYPISEEFNQVVIRYVGRQLVVRINSLTFAKCQVDEQSFRPEGVLALEVRGPRSEFLVRSAEIRELPEDE